MKGNEGDSNQTDKTNAGEHHIMTQKLRKLLSQLPVKFCQYSAVICYERKDLGLGKVKINL